VKNKSDRVPEFFEGDGDNNLLWEYVQSLSPETVSHLSKPTSADVFQVMERNVMGLLGNIPPDHFDVTINTNRENLGRLLASAMVSGYFLRKAEQRMTFEKSLQKTDSSGADAG